MLVAPFPCALSRRPAHHTLLLPRWPTPCPRLLPAGTRPHRIPACRSQRHHISLDSTTCGGSPSGIWGHGGHCPASRAGGRQALPHPCISSRWRPDRAHLPRAGGGHVVPLQTEPWAHVVLLPPSSSLPSHHPFLNCSEFVDSPGRPTHAPHLPWLHMLVSASWDYQRFQVGCCFFRYQSF